MRSWNFVFFLLCLAGTSALQAQQSTILDKVVAQIGSEVILWSDVEEYHAYQKANSGKVPEGARCTILDNLMLKALLAHEARLDTTIIIDDAEVDQQMNRRVDEILLMMNGDVSFFEEYYGKTVSAVKEEMREDLRNQMLTERMQGKILSDIKITPVEVKEFFDRIPYDSLPYFNSEVEISEIVLIPQVNATEKKAAIEKLEKLRQRIIDGEDFATLAKNFSDDPGSARAGGDLGWQKRGAFVQEFEEAAYKLDEGELSPIVESPFGFHMIQMQRRRGNNFNTRHILIKPRITDEDIAQTEARLDSVRQAILRRELSFESAVKRFSDKNAQSYNNGGRMVNPKSGNTFFEVADLDPDIYFAIDSLKPNGVTAPISFDKEDGSKAFRLVQLNSRTPPHKANLQQDFSKIKAAAIEQKKATYLNDWVKEKAESTYVEIDPHFGDCEILSKWLQARKTQP